MVMGNILAQNPALLGVAGSSPSLYSQGQSAGFFNPSSNYSNPYAPPAPPVNQAMPRGSSTQYNQSAYNPYVGAMQNNYGQGGGTLYKGMTAPGMSSGGMSQPQGGYTNNSFLNSFKPQGFQQAGQAINGQFTFTNPNVNFSQRNPYQFTETPRVNVADTFTPQMDLARRNIMEQYDRSQEQLLADMNRRGMLQAGGANRALTDLTLNQRDRQLADMGSQFALQQAQSQMQEDQIRRQMEMQRQMNQAEEIFRQQGATDEQARFLAQQNLSVQGMNLEGRKQATAEEQLANMFRRQPMEDLFRLLGPQMGQIGGTQGSNGLIPSAISTGAGYALGSLI